MEDFGGRNEDNDEKIETGDSSLGKKKRTVEDDGGRNEGILLLRKRQSEEVPKAS